MKLTIALILSSALMATGLMMHSVVGGYCVAGGMAGALIAVLIWMAEK